MDVTLIRQRLLDQIRNADEVLLRMMHAMASEYKSSVNGKVIGHRPDSTPITNENLQEAVKESERAIENGELTSHEALKLEMKNWK